MVHNWPSLDLHAHRTQKRRKLPARKPLTFRQFVDMVNPRYVWYRHCVILAEALQRVADGLCTRLMVFMPPRHGKSELVSRLFTAYYLYRFPDKWVGMNCYSAELAYGMSRNARENYQRAGADLSGDAFASRHWETGYGGGMWAAGVGGSITGKGFHLGIIDDPLKNAEAAQSAIIRNKQKDWLGSTFATREEPAGAQVVVQCMTGDTPVLMADGTERHLREIKVGDLVATYDNGRLGVSKVLNHKSNRDDYIFTIMTTCGKIVRANARHPFLVEEHGQLKWIRLKNLTTAHKIVTLKGSGGNGRGKPVASMGAISPPNVVDSVGHTIKSRNGLTGIVRHLLTLSLIAIGILNTGMGSPLSNMMQCLRRKMENALFAGSHRGQTLLHTGKENCASIIATTQTPSEDSCATTVTWPLDTPKTKQQQSLWPNISDFTVTQIKSIVPAGIEEVFDVQIERTENFIANGLVSHNTRWHNDDISGYLLGMEEDEPERWHIVRFEAIKGDVEGDAIPPTCTVEADFRQPGEALCPERYSLAKLRKMERRIGAYYFGALFQQRPQPAAGAIFKRDWWDKEATRYDPADRTVRNQVLARWIVYDTALKDGATNDYSAAAVWELWPDYRLAIRHMWNERIQSALLPARMEADAAEWNKDGKLRGLVIEDKGSGTNAIQTLRMAAPAWLADMIFEFMPTGTKEYRARLSSIWCERGCILLPIPTRGNGDWYNALLDPGQGQLWLFPYAAHDDMVDTISSGIMYLEHYIKEGWDLRQSVAA